MKIYLSVLTAVTAAWLAAAAAAQPQPPTPQEITALMKSPEVKGSLDACAEGKDVPGEVKAEIILLEDGSLKLSKTDPALAPDVFECIAKAVESAKLLPLDKKYKMTYTFDFAAAPATAPLLPPSAGTASPAPPAAASPAAPSPQPKVFVPNKDFYDGESEFITGRGLLSAGIVISSLALVAYWIVPIFILVQDEVNAGHIVASCSLMAVAVAAGVPLIVVGARKMGRGLELKNRIYFNYASIAPEPAGRGAILSTSFHF